MKERIQEYMNYKNINAGELATSLDVQRSNISHILNGRNKPSAAFIEKMLTVFPDLNARWLLTGDGNMTNSYHEDNNVPDKEQVQTVTAPKTEKPLEAIQKEVKAAITPDSSSTSSPKTNSWDDELDRIVLFYKDGSFTSFVNRSKK